MSKLSSINKSNSVLKNNGQVINFMNGINYTLDPLMTLKMISASSIFGEPSYYRNSAIKEYTYYNVLSMFVFSIFNSEQMSTDEIFENAVNDALEYDFKGTLEWASTLRSDYYMRLNPQVIMVLASKHPKRKEFTTEYPGLFTKIQESVMLRADEPASQFSYYVYKYGSKKNMPNILKKAWARKLESLNVYQVNKYKNSHEGMIDTVRVSHANSSVLDKLMKDNLSVEKDNTTWESLRSDGHNWVEVFNTIKVPYMATLKNLRGIGVELNELLDSNKISRTEALAVWDTVNNTIINKELVLKSKLFPYRFKTAYNMIEKYVNVFNQKKILGSLEQAMDISLANMPTLEGKVAVLSDNSGSAWGAFTSEYGSNLIAEIGNLSAVITAMNSEDGHVFTFGDELAEVNIKGMSIIEASNEVDKVGKTVGEFTEHGAFKFIRDAIENNTHWDTIFLYSDMQAGTADLYDRDLYTDFNSLVKKYRENVNPLVNVYTVQTAGYDNNVMPAYQPRHTLLYGWTGKELLFASTMNKLWDKSQVNKNIKNPPKKRRMKEPLTKSSYNSK